MIKKIISISLLVVFFLSFSTEVDAQRKRSKRKSDTKERSRSSRERSEKETVSFADKLTYDINVGNITLNNGFGITLKPAVGYKFTERLSAGLALRAFYNFVNVRGGDDVSFFSYGPAAYGRFKISEEIYLQGEYLRMSYDGGPNGDRFSRSTPMIGGGYVSGFGPWKFGIQLLFALNEDFREVEDLVDYWFTFTYNF